MLAPELARARILDLFAGTGALGIEALSRGAASAVFVEKDRAAAALLEQNLAVLGDADASVMAEPVGRALETLAARRARFDIVFADPPYDAGLLAPTLSALAEHRLVAARGIVVCEHHGKGEPPAPPVAWHLSQTRAYGDVALSFFGPDKGVAV
jgi:16S rRNA (guanine(966)-N(2))-methyltransferase RsmD